MIKKIPFYRPSQIKSIVEFNTINLYQKIENSIENLESRFREFTNSKYTLSVNNPSLAIHLALLSIDLKRGDKVICAINSYVVVPEAIRRLIVSLFL